MTNSIIRGQMKKEDEEWLNPRLFYLKKFVIPQPTTCPECGAELCSSIDEDETICTECGLITSASIRYVAGIQIDLPYGLRLK